MRKCIVKLCWLI